MRNPPSDPFASSHDAANLSTAFQTAAAAAEQFAARVAQTLGLPASALTNQPNINPTQVAPANATGFAQLFANLFNGRGTGQPFGQLQQTVGQLAKTIGQTVQATAKGRDAANLQIGKLQEGADNMFAALGRGNANVADFAAFVGRANTAVQGFADNLAKVGQMQFGQLFRAQGQFSPRSQQPQFAAQMQVAQQMQQLWSQFSRQIGQSLEGGSQVQQMVDAAKAAGNPQQAIDVARSYVLAQLNQSMINAQNLSNSVDPIMHSFGAPGQLAAQGNLQYLLSQPGQLSDTIRMFQSMLDNLDKMQANLNKAPHMAAGGVVTDPTMALVGERGPEAVIPLNRLQAMFGNPANMFKWNRGAILPQWLTAGKLAGFDSAFNIANQTLNRQLDLGNGGAAALLDRWNQVQDSAIGAVDWMNQHRRISLDSPSTPPGNSAAALHFNFGDIHVASASQQEIGSLFDRIEQEARTRGYDITGRAALRRPPQAFRGPLTPAGFAR